MFVLKRCLYKRHQMFAVSMREQYSNIDGALRNKRTLLDTSCYLKTFPLPNSARCDVIMITVSKVLAFVTKQAFQLSSCQSASRQLRIGKFNNAIWRGLYSLLIAAPHL